MKTIRFITILLTGVVLSTGVLAQSSVPKKKMMPMQGMMNKKMMAGCEEMMQKHEQMQTDMKAMDEKLDSLMATMNSATGSDRMEAITAVLNEMGTQRKEMRQRMSSMQTDMMGHMMGHMKMGSKSMSMCPMMQGMSSSKGAASKSDDHLNHH